VSRALNAFLKTRDGQKNRGEGGVEKMRRVGELLLGLRRKGKRVEDVKKKRTGGVCSRLFG